MPNLKHSLEIIENTLGNAQTFTQSVLDAAESADKAVKSGPIGRVRYSAKALMRVADGAEAVVPAMRVVLRVGRFAGKVIRER